jgi:hypothetical protein
LKNLPKLYHSKEDDLFCFATHIMQPKSIYTDKSGKKRYFTDAISGKLNNSQSDRSRSFPAISNAMVDQWG